MWMHKRFEICGDVPYFDYHTLPTTAGTRFYDENGNDLVLTAKFLGHANTETTAKHYIYRDEGDVTAGLENATWGEANDDE
jgi:hypothetical protein